MERRRALKQVTSSRMRKAGSQKLERRGVLRRVGSFVGGITVLGGGPSQRAKGTRLQYENEAMAAAAKYTSPENIKSQVQTHANGLIKRLAMEGHIEGETTSTLPTDDVHSTVSSYVSADSGVLISASPFSESPQVKIEIKRPIAKEKELILIVSPTSGESRAIVRTLEVSRPDEVISAPGKENVGTTDCYDCRTRTECSTSCTYSSCECVEVTAKICRTDGCDGCYTSSSDCCGDYNCDL